MKLRHALLSFLAAAVCLSLWRSRGNFIDRYWVREHTQQERYCTIVPIPERQVLSQLDYIALRAYRTPSTHEAILTFRGKRRGEGGNGQPMSISVVLDIAKRRISSSAVPPGPESLVEEDDHFRSYWSDCSFNDSESTVTCEGFTYRSTRAELGGSPHVARPFSKSLLALQVERANRGLGGWENILNPLVWVWHSSHGAFAIDFYRRGKPDQILTSLRGGWWGNDQGQEDYARSSAFWISDRYFLIPAELSYRSFLLCDFGGL